MFFRFAVVEHQHPIRIEQVFVIISKFVEIQNSGYEATERFRSKIESVFLLKLMI